MLEGLTIVLYDAFEVVCHQVPQGAFVGQAQAVGEYYGCVHNCTVHQLQNKTKPKSQIRLASTRLFGFLDETMYENKEIFICMTYLETGFFFVIGNSGVSE